jgi:hypothetical protein
VWYQLRLPEHEVYELRECPDFFEKIPEVSPLEHFEYKVQRDQLREAYVVAKRSKVISYIAIVISVASFLFSLVKLF